MVVVLLLIELASGDLDLFGVDDDDKVPGVQVPHELGFPLAADQVGDLGGQAAEDPAIGVDQPPLLFDVILFWNKRPHELLTLIER